MDNVTSEDSPMWRHKVPGMGEFLFYILKKNDFFILLV